MHEENAILHTGFSIFNILCVQLFPKHLFQFFKEFLGLGGIVSFSFREWFQIYADPVFLGEAGTPEDGIDHLAVQLQKFRWFRKVDSKGNIRIFLGWSVGQERHPKPADIG